LRADPARPLMLPSPPASLRRDADRPALLGRRPVGRGQLADLIDGYASALHHRGLRAGDTLGLAVRPGGHAFALLLAAYRLGIRVAVLDPSAGPDVLSARLALAAPGLIVAAAPAQAPAGLGMLLPRRPALGPVATVGPRLPGCAPALAPGGGSRGGGSRGGGSRGGGSRGGGSRGGPPPAGHDGDGDAV